MPREAGRAEAVSMHTLIRTPGASLFADAARRSQSSR
jgi:hypothetical protein